MRPFGRRLKIPPILLIGFALLFGMHLYPAAAGAAFGKSILVLNSYSPGYKWTDEIIAGITEAVRKKDAAVRIHHEFMDTKRIADDEYLRLLHDVYHYKFINAHFDAIITSDNDAFNFMLHYRDQLFPDVPVIACGVNNFNPAQLQGVRGFTGVNEATDVKGNLDLILKLHPDTRNIVVIDDTTTTGQAMHQQVIKLLPAYRDRVQFTLLEDIDMPSLLAQVEKLPPHTLVLFIFFFKDRMGTLFEYNESAAMVSEHSPVPLYGLWDFNLGNGIVGGLLTCGRDQGRRAGELALRVLGGEDVNIIPFVMNVPNRYMFDYRQLQRFHISESVLPPGSTVINRPVTRYTVPRAVIWGAAAAGMALVVIIGILYWNVTVKRRRAETLHRLNEELEMRVRERTEDLERAYRGLQTETEERLRVMEELRMKDQVLIHQARMAAMGEMLGNIAHQWRQPLNVLGLKVQELAFSYKMGTFTPELVAETSAKVMQILSHLSRTIDDFRTFSTPDKQKVQFKVNEVIEKTLSLIGESFANQGISIETACEEDPEINGYPNEYGQVLLNILMNSRDAFQERQVDHPRIMVKVWEEDGRSVVTVRDNAGGIDEEILHKIFDAYFTTKDLGKGTGVGLFMSQTIIKKNMGGELTVRNTGEGVEFRITV